MIDGTLVWLQAEDPNEDISIVLIIWEQLSISVLFKDIQGSNLIDPTLQDNALIGPGIFPYIYPCKKHIQSLFNCQQWTGTWRSEFEQKTNSVLLTC